MSGASNIFENILEPHINSVSFFTKILKSEKKIIPSNIPQKIMLENLYSNRAHGKRYLSVTEILTIFFTDLKIQDFKSCSVKEKNNHGEWKRLKD